MVSFIFLVNFRVQKAFKLSNRLYKSKKRKRSLSMQEIFNRPLNIGDLVFDMDLKYPSIDSFGIVLSDNRIFIGRGREVNCDIKVATNP